MIVGSVKNIKIKLPNGAQICEQNTLTEPCYNCLVFLWWLIDLNVVIWFQMNYINEANPIFPFKKKKRGKKPTEKLKWRDQIKCMAFKMETVKKCCSLIFVYWLSLSSSSSKQRTLDWWRVFNFPKHEIKVKYANNAYSVKKTIKIAIACHSVNNSSVEKKQPNNTEMNKKQQTYAIVVMNSLLVFMSPQHWITY